MHILVTNDDGPPSAQSSPYILPFVKHLEAAGHTVSVILPDTQRSWIGKAHIIGKDIKATYYWPPAETPAEHARDVSVRDDAVYPWVLVDSTPAGAAQIGLNHFFTDRGAIDLVLSGPNYGRNTSACFALSSGTLGAALEAAVCGYKAIALSFAFTDRLNLAPIVAQSCRQSVRVVEWLMKNASWGEAQLYSVNVPVVEGVEKARVVWTRMLQNQWSKNACFQEMGEGGAQDGTMDRWSDRKFKWAPRFTDVYEWVQKAGPGSDGWVVKEGETSITAIRANFMHVDGFEGEVKL